jgi:predicted DNA-binding transcriptional regulator AlpA
VTSVLHNALTLRDRQQHEALREFVTERELSVWLGLSQPTLSRHRRHGTGPAFVRLSPRRVAYRRTAVEAWLQEHAQPKPDAANAQ